MTLSAAGDVRAILVFTVLRIVCVLLDIKNCLIVISYFDGLANNFIICQNTEVDDIEFEASQIIPSKMLTAIEVICKSSIKDKRDFEQMSKLS